ncbi:unnamed protein product [Prunus brigantina]
MESMACLFFYILLVHQEYYVLALGIIMIMGPLTTPPPQTYILSWHYQWIQLLHCSTSLHGMLVFVTA